MKRQLIVLQKRSEKLETLETTRVMISRMVNSQKMVTDTQKMTGAHGKLNFPEPDTFISLMDNRATLPRG